MSGYNVPMVFGWLPEQIRMRLEDQNGGQTTRGTTARTTVSRAFLPGKIAETEDKTEGNVRE